MKIYRAGSNLIKPKNFSRKGKICSCLCPIQINSSTYLLPNPASLSPKTEKVIIKYEVETNTESSNYMPKLKKNQWSTYERWGEFKNVIELPKIFEKLDEEKDFYIKIAYFLRDNIQMPFVYEIVITDYQKYKNIKNKEERRNKLNKIKNI